MSTAELEVFPRQAGMFGGEMLAVSGTCLEPGTKIYCRFGHNDQAVGFLSVVDIYSSLEITIKLQICQCF